MGQVETSAQEAEAHAGLELKAPEKDAHADSFESSLLGEDLQTIALEPDAAVDAEVSPVRQEVSPVRPIAVKMELEENTQSLPSAPAAEVKFEQPEDSRQHLLAKPRSPAQPQSPPKAQSPDKAVKVKLEPQSPGRATKQAKIQKAAPESAMSRKEIKEVETAAKEKLKAAKSLEQQFGADIQDVIVQLGGAKLEKVAKGKAHSAEDKALSSLKPEQRDKLRAIARLEETLGTDIHQALITLGGAPSKPSAKKQRKN